MIKETAIILFEGYLSNDERRSDFLRGGPANDPAYCVGIELDEPIECNVELCNKLYDEGKEIHIITFQPEHMTKKIWDKLQEYGVKADNVRHVKSLVTMDVPENSTLYTTKNYKPAEGIDKKFKEVIV